MTANEMKNVFNLKADGAVFKERTFNDREVSRFLSLAQREFTKARFDALKNRTQRGYGDTMIRQDELAALVTGHAQYKIENHDFMVGTENNGAYMTPDLDITPGASDIFGAWVSIPDECLYILSERCDVTDGYHIARNVMVRNIDPRLYNDLIYDDLKNPAYDTIWTLQAGTFTQAGQTDPSAFDPLALPVSALEESTKYGDQRVVLGAQPAEVTGVKGVSLFDETTVVHHTTARRMNLIYGKGWPVKNYTLNYIKVPGDIVVNTHVPALQVSSEISGAFHDEIVDIAVRLAAASVTPIEGKYQVTDKESAEDE